MLTHTRAGTYKAVFAVFSGLYARARLLRANPKSTVMMEVGLPLISDVSKISTNRQDYAPQFCGGSGDYWVIEGRRPTLDAGRTVAVPGNEGGKTTTTPLPRVGLDPSKPDYTMYLEIFNYKP